jgi:hypothetical protein
MFLMPVTKPLLSAGWQIGSSCCKRVYLSPARARFYPLAHKRAADIEFQILNFAQMFHERDTTAI